MLWLFTEPKYVAFTTWHLQHKQEPTCVFRTIYMRQTPARDQSDRKPEQLDPCSGSGFTEFHGCYSVRVLSILRSKYLLTLMNQLWQHRNIRTGKYCETLKNYKWGKSEEKFLFCYDFRIFLSFQGWYEQWDKDTLSFLGIHYFESLS